MGCRSPLWCLLPALLLLVVDLPMRAAQSSLVKAVNTIGGGDVVGRRHLTRLLYPFRSSPKVKAIVGIFSGISEEYAQRREAVRRSWGPSSEIEILSLQKETGVMVRYVVGTSPDETAMRSLEEEERQYGGMIRLEVREKYHNLVLKMRRYMQWAVRNYDFDFMLKVDDDVYHNPYRLSYAANEWKAEGADFIGCFLWSRRVKPPTSKWFDTTLPITGESYHTYPAGPYAVSQEAARRINHIPDGWLRFYGCGDDCSVAAWMLMVNVTYRDDSRLCATRCHKAAVTVKDGPGLDNPMVQLPQLHADPACNARDNPAAWLNPEIHGRPAFDFTNTNCYQLRGTTDTAFEHCLANHPLENHPLRYRPGYRKPVG